MGGENVKFSRPWDEPRPWGRRTSAPAPRTSLDLTRLCLISAFHQRSEAEAAAAAAARCPCCLLSPLYLRFQPSSPSRAFFVSPRPRPPSRPFAKTCCSARALFAPLACLASHRDVAFAFVGAPFSMCTLLAFRPGGISQERTARGVENHCHIHGRTHLENVQVAH